MKKENNDTETSRVNLNEIEEYAEYSYSFTFDYYDGKQWAENYTYFSKSLEIGDAYFIVQIDEENSCGNDYVIFDFEDADLGVPLYHNLSSAKMYTFDVKNEVTIQPQLLAIIDIDGTSKTEITSLNANEISGKKLIAMYYQYSYKVIKINGNNEDIEG